jgi:hypothetical protein
LRNPVLYGYVRCEKSMPTIIINEQQP